MASTSDDGDLARSPLPPYTRMLLTAHHDRYTQLLRVFMAWKRRAQTQCVRRKRVAAACHVGATFYRRIFWGRWQAFVVEKRQLRREQEVTRNLQDVEETKSPPPSSGECVAVDEAMISSDEKNSDQDKTNAVVLLRKRQYFKRWRLCTKKEVRDAAASANGVVRIRSLHAVRRWQGFVRLKKDRSILQQRAYFFLYYWLLKRSLSRLGRHALIKRQDHVMTVKIVKANRQRLLVKTMQQWLLRLRLHQTLALWRSYVRRRRHQTLLYRPIADALNRKTRHRLLRLAFDVWEKQHARNQAQHMLVRVIDRQLYRKLCQKAWHTWKTKIHQLIHLDMFQRGYQERRLRRVWEAWSAQTRENERQEQHRRRAVRAYYLSLLRKGFKGFQTWHMQQQVTSNRVETMLDAADTRIMASVFSRWDRFTSKRKMQALKCERALLNSESRLVKCVWVKGFRCFFTRALAKKKMMLAAQEQHYVRTVRRSFCMWKGAWQAERDRDWDLDKMLKVYTVRKARRIEAKILENWLEFARAKAARRVVNAQVQGQAQQRTLQSYLSQWVSYVSLLRWQQITCARADQHYKSVISRKCLERWRNNVTQRQHYREKTRTALVHWKLTLQSKVFGRWKQYLYDKRMKQQRIHEALEFRHEQFVRDGLRHWMTAALHLQEQREQRVARTQASNTTHIWRRVAAIAQHWRYLAIRRRAIRGEGYALKRSRNVPRRVQHDAYWRSELQQVRRAQHMKHTAPPPVKGNAVRKTHVLSDDAGGSNWTEERSPLSEFVLLPRNRPQPRRPVEVLLFQAETENLPRPNENTDMHEVLRCGFDFPVEPFAPLRSPPENEAKPSISPRKLPSNTTMSVKEHRNRKGLAPPTAVMPPRQGSDLLLPSTTAKQLDALERQLLVLSQRKKEWKISQEQLEALRQDAESNPQLLSKYRSMEEQHAIRTKQWLYTKERIRSLAAEFQRLRGALQR